MKNNSDKFALIHIKKKKKNTIQFFKCTKYENHPVINHINSFSGHDFKCNQSLHDHKQDSGIPERQRDGSFDNHSNSVEFQKKK